MKRGGEEKQRVGKEPRVGPHSDDDDDVDLDGAAGTGVESSPKIAKANFNDQLLKLYYQRFFPYPQMHRWLSYGNTAASTAPTAKRDYLKRREFSFTIAAETGDVYMRYLSFGDEDAMRRAISSRLPHKIDIGAVYTAPPDMHDALSKEAFYPVDRELVFDIDLTDYDVVRTCCTGADICQRCWKYMNVAVKVMDEGLREDFGFEHILWVYSGRRGIHCWVCDEEARSLSNAERTAVVEYFTAIDGGTEKNASVQVPLTQPMHPSFKRAYATLRPFFEDFIIQEDGQRLLVDEDKWDKVLGLLPASPVELRTNVEEGWRTSATDASSRWELLCREVDRCLSALATKKMSNKGTIVRPLQRCVAHIVFTHTYPRLDVNVSKGMNHLLKSPFCVHPKTGRVCVPINPKTVDSFDPSAVPSVEGLLNELDTYDKTHADDEESATTDIQKTSMRGPVAIMEAFLKPMERKARAVAHDDRELIAGMSNDW